MHYSNHFEYFVDSQRDNQLLRFNKSMTEEDQEIKAYQFVEKIKRHIWNLPSPEVKLPLDLGYCTDQNMACKASDHILCPSWWIEPEKLANSDVQQLIAEKIKTKRNEVDELCTFLVNLYRDIDFTSVTSTNPKVIQRLKSTSLELEDKIMAIVNFKRFEVN
jgi:hypothetical protein